MIQLSPTPRDAFFSGNFQPIVEDNNNFGPRVGLAYSPFDDNKTVIRLGAGIFYNRALLRTLDDYALGEQQQSFDSRNLA